MVFTEGVPLADQHVPGWVTSQYFAVGLAVFLGHPPAGEAVFNVLGCPSSVGPAVDLVSDPLDTITVRVSAADPSSSWECVIQVGIGGLRVPPLQAHS